MNMTLAMKYVLLRAQAEAKATGKSDLSVEVVFLGLLKLAEVTAEDFVSSSAPQSERKQTENDIEQVKKLFRAQQVDTTRVRNLLRVAVRKEAPSSEADLAERLSQAAAASQKDGRDEISACDLLRVICEKPTDLIRQVCPLKPEEEKPKDFQPDEKPEEGW